MDGHRYADDAEPSWYSGAGQYARSTDPEASGSIPRSSPTGNPYDSGIHERPSGAFRLPEQRPAGPGAQYALPDQVTSTGSHARPAEADVRIPVRGTEYPTIRPTGDPAPPPAPMSEPTALVPPIAPHQGRQAETVYQTRRPVSSILVAVVMVVLAVPVVRLLIDATFTGDPAARAIVPAVLLTLGFTLSGIGLFSVARGGPIAREAWLRPPVAYLPAGLILLVAAGLAVA